MNKRSFFKTTVLLSLAPLLSIKAALSVPKYHSKEWWERYFNKEFGWYKSDYFANLWFYSYELKKELTIKKQLNNVNCSNKHHPIYFMQSIYINDMIFDKCLQCSYIDVVI